MQKKIKPAMLPVICTPLHTLCWGAPSADPGQQWRGGHRRLLKESQLPWALVLQANLTKSQNEFKINLKELEDSLLARLSAASGNFLGDTALVENLETTKRTAMEIEEKVGERPPWWEQRSRGHQWGIGHCLGTRQ